MNKNHLTEDDISVKFITPALHKSGWDEEIQTSLAYYYDSLTVSSSPFPLSSAYLLV